MRVVGLAAEAAAMKYWRAEAVSDGGIRMEVPVDDSGRTQVVTVTMAHDGDGDPAAFIWAMAGELSAMKDPVGLLRLNTELTYGRVAVRGKSVLVVHSILDAEASLAQVGKALYWVAKAADDLEQLTYGGSDTL